VLSCTVEYGVVEGSDEIVYSNGTHVLGVTRLAPFVFALGEAGAPGGTMRRAAVRKRGSGAQSFAQSTDFPNDHG